MFENPCSPGIRNKHSNDDVIWGQNLISHADVAQKQSFRVPCVCTLLSPFVMAVSAAIKKSAHGDVSTPDALVTAAPNELVIARRSSLIHPATFLGCLHETSQQNNNRFPNPCFQLDSLLFSAYESLASTVAKIVPGTQSHSNYRFNF